MENKIENLLSYCSKINFGAITLTNKEKEFCRQLNNEIILLCKSLPESTQTDAVLFLMKYLKTPFSEDLNFLRYFYVPAWSIIYWLIQSTPDDKGTIKKDIKNAKIAHSMAMLLHALDDHLNDNELPATHLTLLLRSQSWMRMNKALGGLATGIDGRQKVVQGFINDYYSSICNSKEIESLDNYCDIFRKQMATWLIVPVLLAKNITTNKEFSDAIQTAYGSFGIAWRLLDDINDIEKDMTKGVHSSLYICLPENIKNYWDKNKKEQLDKVKNDNANVILNFVMENNVIDRVRERICCELESAASIADEYDITGLADEFRSLLSPLKKKYVYI